jgi:hypothetical protein
VNLVNADGHESILTGADASAHYRTNGRDRLERTAVTAVAAITVHRVRLFCDRALVLAQAMQRATTVTADSGQRTADSGQRTADSGQRTADSGQRMRS